MEYLGSPHFDLSGLARRHDSVLLVDQPDLDVRQGLAHGAGAPFAAERVGQPHSNFGHPIPFQEPMTGQLLPSGQHPDRQGRRSGQHQAEAPGAGRPANSGRGLGRVPGPNEPMVHGGDGGEEGDVAGGQPIPGADRVEEIEELDTGADPEG